GIHDGLAHMRKDQRLVAAALDLVDESQAAVVMSPSQDLRQRLDGEPAPTRIVGSTSCGCDDDRRRTIGDLAAVLAPDAGLDHRVGIVVVREAQLVELPTPRLSVRVALRIRVVELGDTVEIAPIEPIATLVFSREPAEYRRPHETTRDVFMALPGG